MYQIVILDLIEYPNHFSHWGKSLKFILNLIYDKDFLVGKLFWALKETSSPKMWGGEGITELYVFGFAISNQ